VQFNELSFHALNKLVRRKLVHRGIDPQSVHSGAPISAELVHQVLCEPICTNFPIGAWSVHSTACGFMCSEIRRYTPTKLIMPKVVAGHYHKSGATASAPCRRAPLLH